MTARFGLCFLCACAQPEFRRNSESEAESGTESESEAESESEPGTESESEPEAECEPGASRCVGADAFELCRNGAWVSGSCGGPCVGETCEISRCKTSEIQCTDDGQVIECDPAVGGLTDPYRCPPGESCFSGACNVWACTPGTISCMSTTAVGLCDDAGSGYTVLTACAANEECIGATCINACAEAEERHTSVGCVFYPLDTDNLDGSDDGYQYVIYAANPDPLASAGLTLQVHSVSGWAPYAEASVGPGETYAFYATCQATCPVTCSGSCGGGMCQCSNLGPDRHPEGTGLWSDKAFRLVSSRPISAYQLNSDDINAVATSTGATILLPEGAIDTTYYAVSRPHLLSGYGLGYSAWIAIVGTQDGTSVTVTVTGDTASGGGIGAVSPGDSTTQTIDEGEVLQLASAGYGDDLTGSKIEATAPVAVFSGHENAQGYGFSVGEDHLEEQLHPLVAWGRTFVASATPMYTPAGGEVLFSWRIVTSEDETTVEFEQDGTMSGVPSAPIVLNEGEWIEFRVTGGPLNRGHFWISADKPIEVAEFLDFGPTGMVLMAPVEQMLPRYAFTTTPYFADVLTIVRPTGTSVLFDGVSPSGVWTSVADSHEVLSVDVASDGVAHTVLGGAGFEGEDFGIYVSGNGGSCTYAYLGGLSQERINLVR